MNSLISILLLATVVAGEVYNYHPTRAISSGYQGGSGSYQGYGSKPSYDSGSSDKYTVLAKSVQALKESLDAANQQIKVLSQGGICSTLPTNNIVGGQWTETGDDCMFFPGDDAVNAQATFKQNIEVCKSLYATPLTPKSTQQHNHIRANAPSNFNANQGMDQLNTLPGVFIYVEAGPKPYRYLNGVQIPKKLQEAFAKVWATQGVPGAHGPNVGHGVECIVLSSGFSNIAGTPADGGALPANTGSYILKACNDHYYPQYWGCQRPKPGYGGSSYSTGPY